MKAQELAEVAYELGQKQTIALYRESLHTLKVEVEGLI
jgi:hypothetical protein